MANPENTSTPEPGLRNSAPRARFACALQTIAPVIRDVSERSWRYSETPLERLPWAGNPPSPCPAKFQGRRGTDAQHTHLHDRSSRSYL